MSDRRFLILIVLDGFGCRGGRDWNAIAHAETPAFDRLFAEHRWTELEASGLPVGLPQGQMGNSEVGHLNIGAGRVVDQDVVRITKAVRSGEIARNEILLNELAGARGAGKSVHFVGLLSHGGVHSLQEHLHGLIGAAIANGMADRDGDPSIFVHAILDGRDTPPRSAIANIESLLEFLKDKPQARLSTVTGRYFTMDRDRRWERTKRGYDVMMLGEGIEVQDPVAAIEDHYGCDTTDEFMEPLAVIDSNGRHHGRIEDGDAVFFFNFRADRMRQIVQAMRDDDFDGFERRAFPKTRLCSMTRYHQDFDLPVLFPAVTVVNHLGVIFASQGMKQLRIAETEKYAHVTFFFNGGSDDASEGEERILIPSPKVATYDLQPEMSVVELSDRVVEEIDSAKFDVVIMNIANPDMVGHTGSMEAAVEAVEATDTAIAKILAAVDRINGLAVITADHGNCELMFDEVTGQPHTAHTTSRVPLIVYDPVWSVGELGNGGSLSNVAPTILEILGISKPPEMKGESLLKTGSQN